MQSGLLGSSFERNPDTKYAQSMPDRGINIDEIETHIQQPTLLQIDCWRISYQKTQSRAEMLALNDFILNRTEER